LDTSTATEYTIHFPADYDERDEVEMWSRGYFCDVTVELADGRRFPLYFYDPVRLRQTLEGDATRGRPYYTERGLVVLSEVTPEAIRRAIDGLFHDGYFESQKPLPPPADNGQSP
jgi:hypothetical protein